MSNTFFTSSLRLWFAMLGLQSHAQEPNWYRNRYEEEFSEFQDATTYIEKLSEMSDVFFAINRAHYDGCTIREAFIPVFSYSFRNMLVYSYMFAKYTMRWSFYRMAAWCCGNPMHVVVNEVTNPSKVRKVKEIAERHELNQERFTSACRKLRWVWPLFP